MIIPVDKARIDHSKPPVQSAFKHEGEWVVQLFTLADLEKLANEEGPLLFEIDDDGDLRCMVNYIP